MLPLLFPLPLRLPLITMMLPPTVARAAAVTLAKRFTHPIVCPPSLHCRRRNLVIVHVVDKRRVGVRRRCRCHNRPRRTLAVVVGVLAFVSVVARVLADVAVRGDVGV